LQTGGKAEVLNNEITNIKQISMKKTVRLIAFLSLTVPLLLNSCRHPLQQAESIENHIRPWPGNAHYLAFGDTPVFPLGAAGYHNWTPISRPGTVNFHEQLDRLASVIEDIGSPHVCGFVRILAYDPMNHHHDGAVERVLQPWVKTADGRYDLENFEPEWEERLREFLSAALERRFVVALEVWDGYSISFSYDMELNQAWNGNPFNPLNNINYEKDVLPDTSSFCNAPFFSTIPSMADIPEVLDLQKKYADRLLAIASDYPNIIINITNESRGHLEWSRYWAKYIRERIPRGMMIGEMPSTNRRDGGGECEYEFNPLTLSTDPLYDFVDISQVVSGHEFGAMPQKQVTGSGGYIQKYRQAMIDAGTPRPLIVSKDYTRGPDGGDIVLWGRFISGAATARFHRLHLSHPESVSQFQHDAVGRLGRFIARVPFWHMHPVPEFVKNLPDGAGANVLGEVGNSYVVQLLDGGENEKLHLDLSSGTWAVEWFDPATGLELADYEIEAHPEQTELTVPSASGHLIILLVKK
jgi:hypothetical protein